jgi:glycine/D-amino acid oxidase-like deaminating enzyme
MNQSPSTKTIIEPARKTNVAYEADVVVVGGGPGGVGAAIAAARNGANTVLIERYGHLGGMATGGLVTILPNMSDISGKHYIAGLNQEIIDRLDSRNAVAYPRKQDWGTAERKVVDYYLDANMRHFYVRQDLNTGRERALYTAVFDPEILKDELNAMAEAAGVKLLLHSWCTQPVIEGNEVKGVIIENKSGRQAVLGKVVIDSTGDGDLFVAAGAEFDNHLSPQLRTSKLAMVYWLVNVDVKRYDEFKASHPEKYAELVREIEKFRGFPRFFKDLLKDQGNILWSHPMIPTSDSKDAAELTRVDIDARRRIIKTYEFLKKYMPGFEHCTIMLTSPQLGTQGGRRIIGEYMLTEKDMETDEVFEDTIAIFPNNDNNQISAKHPVMCIPYRTMVPRSPIENLLVACRAYSTSDSINHHFNIIPFCFCLGQAAGTAAKIALDAGVSVRKVDYPTLQDNLRKQGVILPEKKN